MMYRRKQVIMFFSEGLTKKSSTLTHDVRQVCSDKPLVLAYALHTKVFLIIV
jgi:hypothetical protein